MCAKITSRIKQQHQGAADVVISNIGNVYIIADATCSSIGTGLSEVNTNSLTKIGYRRKCRHVHPIQTQTVLALDQSGDFQAPLFGRKVR